MTRLKGRHERRQHGVRHPALVALAAGVVVSTPGWAQDGEPFVPGEDLTLRWGAIDFTRIALDVYGRYEEDRVQQGATPATRDMETLVRGELILEADGFLGHPDLFDLDLDLRLLLSHEQLESDVSGVDQRDGEVTFNYNVSGTLFRKGPAPLTLYGRQDDTVVSRLFGGTLDSTLLEYGARMTLRSAVAPTHFQVYHREQGQSDRLRGTDFDQVQDTFTAHGQLRPGDHHQMNWVYTYDVVDQSGTLFQPNDFERHDLQSNYTYNFGLDNRSFARSVLHFRKQTGTTPVDQLRFDQTVRLYHDDQLESRYEYSYDRVKTAQTQTLNRVRASVRKEIFDSLVINADLGASALRISEASFDSDQIFGDVDLEYTKLVPYGQLGMSMSLNVNHRTESARGTTLQITDEPHVFGGDAVIVLNRQNIIAGSVLITDSTGAIIYTEGVDYLVLSFTDRTEVRRIIGGNITPVQIVLIDYRIGPEPSSTTDTFGQVASVRYDFTEGALRGVGMYGRFENQDQSIRSDDPFAVRPADIQQLTLGVDYDMGRLHLTAEQQWRESSLSPFNRSRVEVRWIENAGRGNSLLLSAAFNHIDRFDDDIITDTTTLSARWNQRVNQQLDLALTVLLRDERGNQGFDAQGVEGRMEFQWRKGQTTLYGQLRGAVLDGVSSDTDSQSFLLGIRREF